MVEKVGLYLFIAGIAFYYLYRITKFFGSIKNNPRPEPENMSTQLTKELQRARGITNMAERIYVYPMFKEDLKHGDKFLLYTGKTKSDGSKERTTMLVSEINGKKHLVQFATGDIYPIELLDKYMGHEILMITNVSVQWQTENQKLFVLKASSTETKVEEPIKEEDPIDEMRDRLEE